MVKDIFNELTRPSDMYLRSTFKVKKACTRGFNSIALCIAIVLVTYAVSCNANEIDEDVWGGCFEDVLSNRDEERASGWNGVRWVATYRPGHPRLKETLLSVLKNKSRSEEWPQAFTHLARCLECDPRLDEADLKVLLERLSHDDAATKHQAVGCFGALSLNPALVIPYLEPLLTGKSATSRDHAASSILLLDGHHIEARQTLLRDLGGGHASDRYCAAFWLGRSHLKDAEALVKLKIATRDAESSVRTLAACSLWHCTKSEVDVLPTLIKSLDDAPVGIVLGSSFVPSGPRFTQHKYAIECLGEIGGDSSDARAVLQRLGRREIPFRGDLEDNISTLLAASGKAMYGSRTYLEAYIAIAEHEGDPLKNAALKQIGPGKLDELKKRVAGWRHSRDYVCVTKNEPATIKHR